MLKITRNLTSSSLTIGVVLAGLALVSSETKAFATVSKSVSLSEFKSEPIMIDNIMITYLSGSEAAFQDFLDEPKTVNLSLKDSEFVFQFNPPFPGFDQSGFLEYLIEIFDPNYYFWGVQLDANASNYKVDKTVFNNENLAVVTELSSINGNPAPLPAGSFTPLSGQLTALIVKDTFTHTGGKLLSTRNQFLLAPRTAVPEPGTVLGLLAVGGISFISRFRKQK